MTEYEDLIIMASASHHRDSAKREAEYNRGTLHRPGKWTLGHLDREKTKPGGTNRCSSRVANDRRALPRLVQGDRLGS
jgi:hypothetical protein